MMTIDKNNYEAYVLDYLEGTISSEDSEQLARFFELHPEYKDALDVDIDLQLKVESADSIFSAKESLLKHPADTFDLPVKDYLLIKNLEEGLDEDELLQLRLVESNQDQLDKEIQDYSKTQLKADHSLRYSGKGKHLRFVLIPAIKQVLLNRSVAAAIIVAMFLSVWMMQDTNTNIPLEATILNQSDSTNKGSILAETKIVEKILVEKQQPSKDSILKLANDPMELKKKEQVADAVEAFAEKLIQLSSITTIQSLTPKRINAYEHGLNVMMPQYLNNNLLSAELANIYRQIDEEQKSPSISLALVESGVKVMNFLSKESVKMQKYYNEEGEVIGYKVKGENVELNQKTR